MEQSTLEASGMDIKFLGTADISYALTALMDLVSKTMQKDISNYLNEAIQATLFPTINDFLLSMGGQYYWDDIEFDYHALQNPIISDTGMTLVIKGEVHIAEHKTPFPNPAVIPADVD